MHNSRARNPLLRWLGSHELSVLLAVAGIAAGIWLFALLSKWTASGTTEAFDHALLMAMRKPGTMAPRGGPIAETAMRDLTALGGLAILVVVTGIAAGFLALDGKGHMALFLCGAIGGGQFLVNVLKDWFHRARPDLVPYVTFASGASFPSGHSMMAAVTYLTLGALLARSSERRALKAYFLLLAILLTVAVGVSRVYLGVHWPTDVLAGWTAGSVWALLCWLVGRWLQRRHTLERPSEHAPQE